MVNKLFFLKQNKFNVKKYQGIGPIPAFFVIAVLIVAFGMCTSCTNGSGGRLGHRDSASIALHYVNAHDNEELFQNAEFMHISLRSLQEHDEEVPKAGVRKVRLRDDSGVVAWEYVDTIFKANDSIKDEKGNILRILD